MISRDIGIVICRVGSVLLLVQAIQGVVYSLNSFEQSGLGITDFLTTASIIVAGPVIGALALWFLARRICSLGPSQLSSNSNTEELSIRKPDIIAAGTYLLGVYVLIFAVVDAVQIASLSMYPRLYADMAELVDQVPNPHGFSRQAGNAAQIILGIGLIIVGRRSGRESLNS